MVDRPFSPMDDSKSAPERKAPNDFSVIMPEKGEKKLKPGHPADRDKAEVKWLTPTELENWKKKFKAAKEYRNSDGRWDRWEENLDYVNCRWNRIWDDDDEHTEVNSIFSNLQAEIPDLYFQQPDVSCISKKPTFKRKLSNGVEVNVDNLQATKLLGIRVNQVLKDCVLEPTIERVIADCKAPYGHGWFKTGYGFETEFDNDLNQEVTKTTYWVRRCDPRTMLVDHLAPSINNRAWTAQEIAREKDELLANSLYVKEKVELMQEGVPDFLKARMDKLAEGIKETVKLVKYLELHDHRAHCIRWICIDGTPMEIREPVKITDWVEGSDFTFLELNVPTDDSIYPLSDVEPVLPQAIARNKIRDAQTKHIENWGITVFTEANFWKDDATEETWRVLGNKVAMCKVADGALSQKKIQIVQPPAIPTDWYNMDQMYKRDNDEILAITAAKQGQTTGDTKAEVLTVEQKANVRTSRQRRKIKLALISVVKKVASKVRAHDTGKIVVDLTGYEEDDDFKAFLKEQFGYEGNAPFLEVDKSAWQGESNWDYELEEQLDRPKSVQVQQYINTFAELGQLPFFQAALEDEADAKFILGHILDLQGLRLDSLKKPALKAKMPAEFENELADKGVEIPPPHPKDQDDYHIFTHLGLRVEMQKALPKLMEQAVGGDMEAFQAYEQVKLSMRYLEEHSILHNLQKKKKEAKLGVLKQANQAPSPLERGQMPGAGQRPVPTQEGIAASAGAMPPGPVPQPGMMPPTGGAPGLPMMGA